MNEHGAEPERESLGGWIELLPVAEGREQFQREGLVAARDDEVPLGDGSVPCRLDRFPGQPVHDPAPGLLLLRRSPTGLARRR